MDKGMMKRMMMCKSQDLKDAMGMAKQLCGDGKMGGSGSGAAKKITTAKPASTLCAGALKTLGGFKDITDVKKVNMLKKAVLCKAFKDIDKVKLASIKFACKSEDVKRSLKTADALCGAKKTTTAKAGSGSGAAKKITTAKPASTLCAGALKTLGGFKDITDVKNVNMLKKAVLCKAFKDIDGVKLAAIKFSCKSEDVKRLLKTADALCGAKKITTTKAGSGSGGAKKTTTAKPASTLCAGALKTLGVFKGLQDVKSALGITACNMYNGMDKDMMSKLMMCKSPELKDAVAEAKALCAGKKVVAKEVIETKIVQKKRVIATQGISKDFTLPKYTKEMKSYQAAFIVASGADEAESTVEYTQVAAKSTGRRRLAEGTSVAHWVLGYENDDKATAAQAKVASKEFSDTVAKESGVQVEAAKASIKVIDVKVNVKVVK